MSYGITHYQRSYHGDPGVGKRPDELDKPSSEPFDVGIAEAARMLGLTVSQVTTRIRNHTLSARRPKHYYMLRRSEVERYAERLAGER